MQRLDAMSLIGRFLLGDRQTGAHQAPRSVDRVHGEHVPRSALRLSVTESTALNGRLPCESSTQTRPAINLKVESRLLMQSRPVQSLSGKRMRPRGLGLS